MTNVKTDCRNVIEDDLGDDVQPNVEYIITDEFQNEKVTIYAIILFY